MAFVHPKNRSSEAENVVEQQLLAFNARDIDSFLQAFSKDIKVYDFPNKPTYEGHKKLIDRFSKFFAETPDLHCEIKNRIIIGNTVIDDEYLTVNGEYFNSVAIYETEAGKIIRMTVMQ